MAAFEEKAEAPGITRRDFVRATSALGLAPLVGASGAVFAAQQPKRGGTLVMGADQAPRHLNGAIQSGMATALPSTQLFASLVRYDDKWNPLPYLATSWEWSDDKLALTTHLHPDAVFHDGKPVTSEDVAFSLMTIKENHPFKTMLAAVEKVDTPDPHTAVIRLSHPHPALLIALSPALAPILPKHVYGGSNIQTNPHNSQGVVGSGPFKFKEFVPGRHVVLERFDNFFLKGKPYLDQVVIQINQDDTTLLISLERGDLQMLPFVGDPTVLRRAKANKNIVIVDKGYEGIGAEAWLAFNLARKPFDDKRVRQAIAYCIDKNFILKALMAGFAKPAWGPIVSSSPYFDEAAIHKYPLDLNKAKQLLDEAGLKPGADGTRFKMGITIQPGLASISKNIPEYVRVQLKKVGIQVNLIQLPDFPSWAKRAADHDFDMMSDDVWNWGDPVIGVDRTYLSTNIRNVVWTNTQSYRNPKVDELLKQAATETNPEKRKKLYSEFQSIVTDDLPVYYTVQIPYHTLAQKNVGNLPTSIWGAMSPLDDVYLT